MSLKSSKVIYPTSSSLRGWVSIRRKEQERGYSTTSHHNNVNKKTSQQVNKKTAEQNRTWQKNCKRRSFQPSDLLTAIVSQAVGYEPRDRHMQQLSVFISFIIDVRYFTYLTEFVKEKSSPSRGCHENYFVIFLQDRIHPIQLTQVNAIHKDIKVTAQVAV